MGTECGHRRHPVKLARVMGGGGAALMMPNTIEEVPAVADHMGVGVQNSFLNTFENSKRFFVSPREWVK